MLQMYCKDRNGVRVLYQERDMQYDVAQGYFTPNPYHSTWCFL